jgi:hypothetical protein
MNKILFITVRKNHGTVSATLLLRIRVVQGSILDVEFT